MSDATPLSSPGRPRAVVVGATGYAGRELTGILSGHPGVELSLVCSARPGAVPPAPTHPGQTAILPFDPQYLEAGEVVFLATPHGTGAPLARRALDAGARVVDLSADFRLTDPALYARVYGLEHGAPDLLDVAVYGLVEHARRELASACLAAGPGCYPTSVLLPTLPLVEQGALRPGSTLIANCASGVSGAGKSPSEVTLFGNVNENFRAYAIGSHRHQPEMQQVIDRAAEDTGKPAPEVVFVPHLLPNFRGILATLYLEPAQGWDAGRMRAVLEDVYRAEPFVFVQLDGEPGVADVTHSNRCHMSVTQAGSRVVITSVIDNLVKGAAGQAVQAMNCMLGMAETSGLATTGGLGPA